MKRYFSGLFGLVFLLLFTGCVKKPEDVFSQNSAERMDAALQKASKALLNNKKGWIIKYFPDLEFGGFTIFALFKSENEVTLTSDFGENEITSSYAVLPEAGPLLTFNGYNKVINVFTEPGADNGGIGNPDTGMKGDFEFVILEVTDKKITLKGKKTQNIIVMEAIPDDKDPDEIAGEYRKASEAFRAFQRFKVETAKGEKALKRGLLDVGWFDQLELSTFQLPDDANSELLYFRVTPGGLEFYKEYELEGITFQQLSYVSPTAGYPLGYYTNDNKTIKIVAVE